MAKKKKKLPIYMEDKLKVTYTPKNKKQKELYDYIINNEITIVKGVSGSGKTYVTLAAALNLLGDKYKNIVLVKSLTTVPEEALGFLKGSLEDKINPYMMSFMWNINKLCGRDSAENLLKKEIVQILPIAFVRGITLDNSIVIIDESQNLSEHTFKTLMTRIGEDSKYIFMGDTDQIDRKRKSESPLEDMFNILGELNEVKTIEFTDEDCVRNPIIPKLLSKLKEHGR